MCISGISALIKGSQRARSAPPPPAPCEDTVRKQLSATWERVLPRT